MSKDCLGKGQEKMSKNKDDTGQIERENRHVKITVILQDVEIIKMTK